MHCFGYLWGLLFFFPICWPLFLLGIFEVVTLIGPCWLPPSLDAPCLHLGVSYWAPCSLVQNGLLYHNSNMWMPWVPLEFCCMEFSLIWIRLASADLSGDCLYWWGQYNRALFPFVSFPFALTHSSVGWSLIFGWIHQQSPCFGIVLLLLVSSSIWWLILFSHFSNFLVLRLSYCGEIFSVKRAIGAVEVCFPLGALAPF